MLVERYADPMRRGGRAGWCARPPSRIVRTRLSVARVRFHCGCRRVPIDTRAAQPAGHRRWLHPCDPTRSLLAAAGGALLLGTAACGGSSDSRKTSPEREQRWRRQGHRRRRRTGLHREPDHGGDLPEAAGERRLLRADQARHHPGRLRLPELSRGSVDIVPDYPAGITDHLNAEKNGPDAPGVQPRPGRDPRRSSPGRGRGHLDPAAVGRDRPERLLRHPGLRGAERPDDALRLRCDEPADRLGAPPDCEGPVRLRGRPDQDLRLRHHPDRPARLRQRPGQGRGQERRGQMGETGTTDGTLEDLGLVPSRTTRASSPRRTSRRPSTPTSSPTTATSRTSSTSCPPRSPPTTWQR